MDADTPYRFITDLRRTESLLSEELRANRQIWLERKSGLSRNPLLDRFNEELAREWSVETGIIEGIYTVDRGTTTLLIERGFHEDLIAHEASGGESVTRIIAMLKDHREALDGIFSFIKQQRKLSLSYIKELHQALLRHQNYVTAKDQFGRVGQTDLLKGEWKKQPNNPTREDGTTFYYCPPEQVASEMDNLMEWHHRHLESGVPAEIEAAWLHHRFSLIHPFQDGNGRVARSLVSLIFIRDGLFPLTVRREERGSYLDTLAEADSGNLKPLTDFFVKVQIEAIRGAIKAANSVDPEAGVGEALSVYGERLKRREFAAGRAEALYENAVILTEYTAELLREPAEKLDTTLKRINASYTAEVEFVKKPSSKFNRSEVEPLRYFATITIREHKNHHLVFLFSPEEREMLFSCAVFLQEFEESSEGPTVRNILRLLLSKKSSADSIRMKPFPFSYNENIDSVKKRFKPWFDQVIIEGINILLQKMEGE